jgi:hypothetical protein
MVSFRNAKMHNALRLSRWLAGRQYRYQRRQPGSLILDPSRLGFQGAKL